MRVAGGEVGRTGSCSRGGRVMKVRGRGGGGVLGGEREAVPPQVAGQVSCGSKTHHLTVLPIFK